ncbi:peptidoglycan-binding protein [Brasilonema sp. CT11]|nr:peptidoglycan-binding protein [Brasilonema sp. CT11]
MKSSIKTNPLNDSPFFKSSVNSGGMKTEQRSQALLNVKILLSCGVSLLLGLSTVSIASQPQQIAQTTSSEGINRPTLQIGSKGERVTELQAALKLLGFYTGTVDGEYKESTVVAVSRFQEAAGLKPDGIVDTTTWQRLFPGETTVASSGSSPNSTSRPPLASGTSNTNQVVVPSSNSTAPTPTTTNTPSAATSKPEPAPAGRNTTATTTTRQENSKPEPRSVTRKTTATTRTREDDSKTEPRSVTRKTTGGSQRTNVQQSTSTRSGSTRSEQSIRTQQSDRSGSTRSEQSSGSRSTTRTQQVASIQYTSEGLPILRIGMRGPEVVRLQRRLQRLGLLNENEVDGDFGQSTEAAVIALQKRYGVEADGVAGGGTWDILMRRRGG